MVKIRAWALGAAALLALNFSGVSLAGTLAAQPSFSGTTVGFAALKAYSGGTLSVIGPNGFFASTTASSGLPSLNLARFGAVPNGQYSYQLDAATAQPDRSAVVQNDGRSKKANVVARSSDALSGTFLVRGGSIVTSSASLASEGGSDVDH